MTENMNALAARVLQKPIDVGLTLAGRALARMFYSPPQPEVAEVVPLAPKTVSFDVQEVERRDREQRFTRNKEIASLGLNPQRVFTAARAKRELEDKLVTK